MVLKDKKILLGVTGGIAAYKAAMLVRLFKRQGAEVRVVMTEAAKDFITPLTMATLSGNPILVENFDPQNGAWNSHISLGEWADLFVIAPATANTLAKMAAGVADNLLLCTYLSARCGVMVATAMDLDMYAHVTTQRNLDYLREVGVIVIEPEDGFLASGLIGKGRMCEPETICETVISYFAACGGGDVTSSTSTIRSSVIPSSELSSLAGIRVLVTAGATVENIDPVRFISNYSTGKMGFAIVDELVGRGADVVLVSGVASATLSTISALSTNTLPDDVLSARTGLGLGSVNRIDVRSADEMYSAVADVFQGCDVAVFCAAVADYRPAAESVSDVKIKHHGRPRITLELEATRDIAFEMGRIKRLGQVTVGFALETDNEIANATSKLKAKNLDAIVLNSMAQRGAGFGGDTNKITILSADTSITPIDTTDTAADTSVTSQEYELKSKREVAVDIVDWIEKRLQYLSTIKN